MIYILLIGVAGAQTIEIPAYGSPCVLAQRISSQTEWMIHCEERVRNVQALGDIGEPGKAVDVPFSFDPSAGLATAMADFIALQNVTTTTGAFDFIQHSPTTGVLVQSKDPQGSPVMLPLDTVVDVTAADPGGSAACREVVVEVMRAIHGVVQLTDVTIEARNLNHPRLPGPDFKGMQCQFPENADSGRNLLLAVSDTVNAGTEKWLYRAEPWLPSMYQAAFFAIETEIPEPPDTGADTAPPPDTASPADTAADTAAPADPTCSLHPCRKGKVNVCHKPGEPAQKTLCVSENALPAHLGHGDACGECK